jgi:hypothetical protein
MIVLDKTFPPANMRETSRDGYPASFFAILYDPGQSAVSFKMSPSIAVAKPVFILLVSGPGL